MGSKVTYSQAYITYKEGGGPELLKVADLMDPKTNEWMSELLEELFTPEEVQLICKVPPSVRNPVDRIVWHFTKNGLYNVKSGYHVFRKMFSLILQASTSSSNSDTRSLWNKVWRAGVQPKVKSFIWRFVRGIVLTKRHR